MEQFDHEVMPIGLLQAEDAHNWPYLRTNCLALGTVCASTDSAFGTLVRRASVLLSLSVTDAAGAMPNAGGRAGSAWPSPGSASSRGRATARTLRCRHVL